MSGICVALMILQIYDCVGVSRNNLPQLFTVMPGKKMALCFKSIGPCF